MEPTHHQEGLRGGPGGAGDEQSAWPAFGTARRRSHLQLRRPVEGRILAGVAAGLADHFDVDVVLVRIAIVVLTLMGGIGLPLYLAAWLVIPEEGTDECLVEHLLPLVGADDPRSHDVRAS